MLIIFITSKKSPSAVILAKRTFTIWDFSIHISYGKTIDCYSIACKTSSCFIPICKEIFYVICWYKKFLFLFHFIFLFCW